MKSMTTIQVYYSNLCFLCSEFLQKESTLVYGNGVLKPGTDKELPNKQKKWLLPGLSAQPGSAIYIPDRYVHFNTSMCY